MVTIDAIEISKNPVNANEEFTITVTLHEDYENSKRYPNKYPHRYGEKGE